MPRASRAASAATRERVLQVASRRFGELGYAEVGVAAIAAAAGVTRGAVYNHFADKRALFEEVLHRAHASVAARIEHETAGLADPWQALEVGCETFLVAATDPTVRRVLLVDGPAVVGWRSWRAADRAPSETALDRGLTAAGVARPAATAALSGAMNALSTWVAPHDDPALALPEAVETVRLLLAGLRAGTAGSGDR